MAQQDRAKGTPDEREVVEALRAGEEWAFLALVDRFHAPMVRLARTFAGPEAANDVVQDAWIGVLQGVGSFEGRSSLRSWIMTIVANRARSRFRGEARSVPMSSLGEAAGEEPAVEPHRFLPPDHPEWPGHWAAFPAAWPEERVQRAEALELVRRAILELPQTQRLVITLRDVEGWEAGETCQLLGLSESNQRVLLHRARSRVRRALERHLLEDGT